MMMVVAVMAEALHLSSKVRAKPPWCQMLFLLPLHRQAENQCVPTLTRLAVVLMMIPAVCLACAAPARVAAPQANSTQSASRPKAIPPPEARVDINHASVDQLLKVPGMTPSWAGRIVRFRPYRSKQDLLEHGVLPSDVYDRIKDYVIAHRGEQ
ncbi:MAG: helix-hairpin-helix domain-containing protein [Terracidiphilus sp.]